jgi:integrase
MGFPAEQSGKEFRTDFSQERIMARTIRDAALESRTARSRLKPRGQPYYRGLEPGLLHLGYRKPLAGAGKWLARHYVGDATYRLHKIGTADDYSDPDGTVILSFKQAQAQARKLLVERAGGGIGTVGDAMDAYVRFLENDGRSRAATQSVRYADRAFIRPTLGDIELAKLTADQLRRWRDDLVRRPARLRTKVGAPQQYRRSDGPDARRARRATAKRIWATLRAALNRAFEDEKVASDRAWRRVKSLRNTDMARARYLTLVEAKRLINAANPEFRPLLQAALLSGARYGQLVALTVADFNPDVGTLRLRSRKGRGNEKTYYAHLSVEGQDFFARACAGRTGTDLIFTRTDGTAWGRANQIDPIKRASARAKINPPVNFHVTRHTFASHTIMNGAPLLVVAKTLGHSDTRMVERVYGHLAPSFVADAIRAAAPRFGISAGNVRSLTAKS